MLVAVPTVVTAWLFGLRAGVAAAAAAVALNTVLILLSGTGSALSSGTLMGHAVLFFFTIALGAYRQLSSRLSSELLKRQALEAAEHQRSAELEAVYRASLQLTSTLELMPILDTILTQVSTLLHAQNLHIFLYDGEKLSFGTALLENVRRDEPFREPRSDGLTYTVARTGKPLLIPRTEKHVLFQDWDDRWTGAIAGFPLSIGERVYGVMNMAFSQPHEFTESELRIVQLLADQAALAIRNASDYASARHYAEELAQRVAERTTELVRAKESAEALLNNSFDAILLLSCDGIIQQTNPAFERVFGFEHGQQRAFATLFQDTTLVEEALRATVSERTLRQFEATALGDQREFTADVVFVPLDSAGTGVEIICNLRDVSERKRAEMRQQALTLGLRRVLALAYDLISSPDIDSLWKRAVESAREALELERCGIFVEDGDQMCGTFGTDFNRQTVDERGLRILKSERSWLSRSNIYMPDAPSWQLVTANLSFWDGSESVKTGDGWMVITPIYSAYRFIGLFTNDAGITHSPVDEIKQEILAIYCSLLGSLYEHKRVENDLRRALEREKELGELKSRFTSMISHELRTPLASIQLSSDMLRNYADRLTPEKTLHHLDRIQTQVVHLTNLLEDVLTFTKGEQVGLQLQLKPLDLQTFCADLVAEVRATKQTHQLEFSAIPGDWSVRVDPKLLRQALLNLLLNAVKYSPPGSTVTFTLDRADQSVVLTVIDQGIGIPEGDLERIFEIFYRAKNVGTVSGTGLGLALVRQIAEAHHGLVFCESQVGEGTTFTVCLPVFSAPTS
ncbi:MAG: ATP-binding protein [Chloroflexota bacterium]